MIPFEGFPSDQRRHYLLTLSFSLRGGSSKPLCYALVNVFFSLMVMEIIWTATPEALVSSDMGGNFPNKTFAPTNTPRETSSNYGPFNNYPPPGHSARQRTSGNIHIRRKIFYSVNLIEYNMLLLKIMSPWSEVCWAVGLSPVYMSLTRLEINTISCCHFDKSSYTILILPFLYSYPM